MNILGISAYYHDSAACLVVGHEVVAAAQEERFTRKKHDSAFPALAIQYCLAQAGLTAQQVDHVVFYDKPFLKFERLLETYLAFAPRGWSSFVTSLPVWIKDKLFQRRVIEGDLAAALGDQVDWGKRLLFSEHHLSHAASAFFPSPFERAAVLTMDGVGEWTTTSVAQGSGNQLSITREIHFPHSLGLLYSAMTYYTGFKVNSGEYKVMGLAPYGQPRFSKLILDNLIDVKDDGSFSLDMGYFNYCTGLTMTNAKFDALFGGPARQPESPLTQREMDLAASIQDVVEHVVLKMARHLAKETGERDLCLAGGVALNCVANGKLLRDGCFDRIWIQPAAGDAGGALGAALAVSHMMLGEPRTSRATGDAMKGAYLGPAFSQAEVEAGLAGAVYTVLSDEALIDAAAQALADGKAMGWMQGRMEFGPRSLGGRSILADPRSAAMQKQLNLKVKFRESFRPFAPSVLREARHATGPGARHRFCHHPLRCLRCFQWHLRRPRPALVALDAAPIAHFAQRPHHRRLNPTPTLEHHHEHRPRHHPFHALCPRRHRSPCPTPRESQAGVDAPRHRLRLCDRWPGLDGPVARPRLAAVPGSGLGIGSGDPRLRRVRPTLQRIDEGQHAVARTRTPDAFESVKILKMRQT